MKKYAYVMILYGDSIYFVGALVTGWSLKKVTNIDKHDIIILCTPDVPLMQKKLLEKIYTRVINIEYAKVRSTTSKRFKDVFTKLKCLELEEYEKIVLMDIDMCVVKSLDYIFILTPPAGSLINPGKMPEIKHGDPIPKNRILENNKFIYGVNAGLLLLKPDKKEYDNIINDLESHPEKLLYEMPEQEYLSRRWYDMWTNVSFYYNYQFGLTGRIKRNKLNNYNEIRCYHYSSSVKPWFILSEGVNNVREYIIKRKQWSWYPFEIWMMEYNELVRKIKNKYNVDVNELMKENVTILHSAIENINIKKINNYFLRNIKQKIIK